MHGIGNLFRKASTHLPRQSYSKGRVTKRLQVGPSGIVTESGKLFVYGPKFSGALALPIHNPFYKKKWTISTFTPVTDRHL
jgi:hypothetical protein